ncbi:methyltransferase domain-containing protein [Marinobacteraceae bacterium S3BR75-40.1]
MSASQAQNTIRRPCVVCGNLKGRHYLVHDLEVLGLETLHVGYRVCSKCGMVQQDPAVSSEAMLAYYRAYSNYTNPSRAGQPTVRKVKGLDTHLAFVERQVMPPGRAFQVGCSDGYTLHRFQQRGWTVKGCDPSPLASSVANSLWNIDTEVTDFESYTPSPGEQYDLIILTHVLEHLYDPVAILRKCDQLLKPKGFLFVEVPLLIPFENHLEGYFTIEHINYFSNASLNNTLARAGMAPVEDIENDFSSDQYPVQRVMVQKSKVPFPLQCEPAWADRLLSEYEKTEEKAWRAIEQRILHDLAGRERALIWGAGVHTSHLLSKTALLQEVEIAGIIDSDPQKTGQPLAGVAVRAPQDLAETLRELPIIISSRASEGEIQHSLLNQGIAPQQIITLYDHLDTKPA